MAKFYGAVGYSDTKETSPGVFEPCVVERQYYGDVTKNVRRLEGEAKINDDIAVSNVISIVSDPYTNQHFFAIEYVKWMGVAWKVSSVEVQSPRLILTLGGMCDV